MGFSLSAVLKVESEQNHPHTASVKSFITEYRFMQQDKNHPTVARKPFLPMSTFVGFFLNVINSVRYGKHLHLWTDSKFTNDFKQRNLLCTKNVSCIQYFY